MDFDNFFELVYIANKKQRVEMLIKLNRLLKNAPDSWSRFEIRRQITALATILNRMA